MWVTCSRASRCGAGSAVLLVLALGCSGSSNDSSGTARGGLGSGAGVLGPTGVPGATGGAATSGGAFGNASGPVGGGTGTPNNVMVMECASALVNTSRAMPII